MKEYKIETREINIPYLGQTNLNQHQLSRQTKSKEMITQIINTHLFLAENEGFNIKLSDISRNRIVTVKLLPGATKVLIKNKQWQEKDIDLDGLLFMALLDTDSDKETIHIYIYGKDKIGADISIKYIEIIPEKSKPITE